MVGDAAKNVGEPGLRIDAVEFCRFDQDMAPLTGADFRLWLFATETAHPSFFRFAPNMRHSDRDVGFRAV